MNSHLYECLAPLATIASLTALALIPPLAYELVTQSALIEKQQREILFGEEFLINCLSGRTMVVGRVAGVQCVVL